MLFTKHIDMQMFGLCDCNNFYVSCERVFRPDLQGKPVVVLSNNDGCIVARSQEIKDLGVKMGEPFFKIKDLVKKHNIISFSSNYELYADMSNRVMTILAGFAPETEIYSIDECFLNLTGLDTYALSTLHTNDNQLATFHPLKAYGTTIVQTVQRGTGIPVCMGIAPTKTLAKLANRFAKKYAGYNRVCLIDTPEKTEKALKLTDVGDIWGIGAKHSKRLNKQGVMTAYDFIKLPKAWVRKNMTVVGERIWRELQGESCLPLETVPPDKKQICTSRSFGQPVTELSDLSAAVAGYAGQCAYKLRKQNSVAVSLMVFVSTNWFNKELPQYHNSRIATLPVPTSSTSEIVKYARMALDAIYRPHFQYKKAGVIITEISNTQGIQQNLFYGADLSKHDRLMKTIDRINDANSRPVIQIAAASSGIHEMKRGNISPRYTTRLENIITVKP